MSRALPPRPNLEHLSKEAKSLVRRHRNRDDTVCETLRLLNRFAGLSAEQILNADLVLAEAQYALALDYGFKSWGALKESVQENREDSAADDPDRGARSFDAAAAWAAIERGAEALLRLPQDVRASIVGVVATGSIVRGDFLANRSSVHLYTVLTDDVGPAWSSSVHGTVRECFGSQFRPYIGRSWNPGVWDDVTLNEGSLPRTVGEAGRHRFKGLGIFYFDTRPFHRTVWGRDFTESLPEPVDPKPLVLDRLGFMVQGVDEGEATARADRGRMPLLVEIAVVLLQLYFGPEPTLNKFEVLSRYDEHVPEFRRKGFGRGVWEHHLTGEVGTPAIPAPSFDEGYRFLLEARDVVRRHPLSASAAIQGNPLR